MHEVFFIPSIILRDIVELNEVTFVTCNMKDKEKEIGYNFVVQEFKTNDDKPVIQLI